MTPIQNIEQRLNHLRATLAQTERWSPAWMQAWLAEAHLSGELARQKKGLMNTCGCSLCRESRAIAQATLRVTKVVKPMGRPPVTLPMDRLRELYQQGHGYRAIAEVMTKEHGVGVSHMTVKRRLSGRRKG